MNFKKGDAVCQICGAEYFSDTAGYAMEKYNLCWSCTTDYYKQVGPGEENLDWKDWIEKAKGDN